MRFVGRTKLGATTWAKASAASMFLMFCVSSEVAPNRALLSEGEITCTLEAVNKTISLGNAPDLRVRLKNNSASMLLVGSLDGDLRNRYPLCRMDIRGPDGQIVDKPIEGICGNQNPLRREDFVEVGEGDEFDPYMRIDDYGFFPNFKIRSENFDRPGTYTIQFTYSTMSEDFEDYSPAPELNGPGKGRDLLAKVPRVHVVSNTVTVEVVDTAD